MPVAKPTQTEEEYFARVEIEKKKKLADEVHSKFKQEERVRLKEMHFMHCSKCGMDLHSLAFRGVVIEKCYACGAVVLDHDEFEKLAGTDGNSLISKVVELFR